MCKISEKTSSKAISHRWHFENKDTRQKSFSYRMPGEIWHKKFIKIVTGNPYNNYQGFVQRLAHTATKSMPNLQTEPWNHERKYKSSHADWSLLWLKSDRVGGLWVVQVYEPRFHVLVCFFAPIFPYWKHKDAVYYGFRNIQLGGYGWKWAHGGILIKYGLQKPLSRQARFMYFNGTAIKILQSQNSAKSFFFFGLSLLLFASFCELLLRDHSWFYVDQKSLTQSFLFQRSLPKVQIQLGYILSLCDWFLL